MKKLTDFVLDREGNAVVGAEVYIRRQADNTLATIYSDDGSTTTNNPIVTDSDGKYAFYAANDIYKFEVYVDGVEEQEVTNVQHIDIDNLTDPGADRLVGWDDSGGAIGYFEVGSGLAFDGTTIDVSDGLAGIAALADPNADRILFWDDSAGAYAYLTASTGLTINTTNLTVDAATTAQVLNNTADKVLVTDDTWAAGDYVALTPGTNVAVDMSTGINFSLAMGGNYTLDNPTNTKNGQAGEIIITQDGTGSRTLAFGSAWKFVGGVDPTLSTAADAVDVFSYKVVSSTFIIAALSKGFA